MKKFVFELEDVLKFRDFEREQAEMELAKALNAEREVQNKINSLAQKLSQSQKSVKNSKNLSEISKTNQYIQFVKDKTEIFLKELAELKLITEQKKEKLKLCIQKTDSLKNLKEAQYSEYKKNLYKAEDEVIDDIVTTRFNT